jgi:uncharacterized membrane protein (DUF485 family)
MDWAERIIIAGFGVILLGFVIGWAYLFQLAAHLDALDRLAK